MEKKDKRQAATALILRGHCVRLNPVNQRKPSFQTTTERAAEEPRAKQGLCKAEIKNVWVDKRRGEMEAERETEEMSQKTTTVVVKSLCGHYKK